MPLTIHNVANVFVKMRRHQEKAKAHHLTSNSGEPQTHSPLLEDTKTKRKLPMSRFETFTCSGGVDTTKLIRAARMSLIENAEIIGANALVDEQWTCTICRPKNRRNSGTYRVHVYYTAQATLSQNEDPHRPVSLDKAKSIPGLMTVHKRQVR
jgi:hypothetical protein